MESVKTLVSLDANINVEDSLGKTPLDFADISTKLVYTSSKDVLMSSFHSGGANKNVPRTRTAIVSSLHSGTQTDPIPEGQTNSK